MVIRRICPYNFLEVWNDKRTASFQPFDCAFDLRRSQYSAELNFKFFAEKEPVLNAVPKTVPKVWYSQDVKTPLSNGPVAQLGARFHGMEEVKGSNPFRS